MNMNSRSALFLSALVFILAGVFSISALATTLVLIATGRSSLGGSSYSRASAREIVTDLAPGANAQADNFAVIEEGLIEDGPQTLAQAPGEVFGIDSELKHTNVVFNLPLVRKDFYGGKYENARAGAGELNRIPALKSGMRVRVIADGYITLQRNRGYVQPRGYYFGSGLCWSTSALGGMMDVANRQFKQRYGVDLFVFSGGDRAPHSHKYETYTRSNRGGGYTVLKSGSGGQDLRFTVNPKLKTMEGLSDIVLDVEMVAQDDFPGAYKGQSIGAILRTNKPF